MDKVTVKTFYLADGTPEKYEVTFKTTGAAKAYNEYVGTEMKRGSKTTLTPSRLASAITAFDIANVEIEYV